MNKQQIILPCFWDESQTAQTLTARNAGGAQRMPDKEHFQCVIDVINPTPKEIWCATTGGFLDIGLNTAPTVLARDYKDPMIIAYKLDNEPNIICFEPGSSSRVGGHIYTDGKTGALRARPGDNMQAVAYKKGESIGTERD